MKSKQDPSEDIEILRERLRKLIGKLGQYFEVPRGSIEILGNSIIGILRKAIGILRKPSGIMRKHIEILRDLLRKSIALLRKSIEKLRKSYEFQGNP